MRLSSLFIVALAWPAVALAHGDATTHLHPHGEVTIPVAAAAIALVAVTAIGAVVRVADLRAALRRRLHRREPQA